MFHGAAFSYLIGPELASTIFCVLFVGVLIYEKYFEEGDDKTTKIGGDTNAN
jgi:hypothetical protein